MPRCPDLQLLWRASLQKTENYVKQRRCLDTVDVAKDAGKQRGVTRESMGLPCRLAKYWRVPSRWQVETGHAEQEPLWELGVGAQPPRRGQCVHIAFWQAGQCPPSGQLSPVPVL